MDSSHRLAPDVLVPRRRGSGPRVAFYSHDTPGLGHVRRNSLLAAAMVAADPDVNVLLLSGASEAGALPLPDRTDIVTVPGLAKDVTVRYRARELDCSLEQVLAVRSAALESGRGSLFLRPRVRFTWPLAICRSPTRLHASSVNTRW